MSIKYTGFSKRAGRIKCIISNEKSERRDIIRLYLMFDADTIITCIAPKTKKNPERELGKLELKDLFNAPKK